MSIIKDLWNKGISWVKVNKDGSSVAVEPPVSTPLAPAPKAEPVVEVAKPTSVPSVKPASVKPATAKKKKKGK